MYLVKVFFPRGRTDFVVCLVDIVNSGTVLFICTEFEAARLFFGISISSSSTISYSANNTLLSMDDSWSVEFEAVELLLLAFDVEVSGERLFKTFLFFFSETLQTDLFRDN